MAFDKESLNVSRVQFQNQFPTNLESISDYISGNSEWKWKRMKMRTNLVIEVEMLSTSSMLPLSFSTEPFRILTWQYTAKSVDAGNYLDKK